MLTEIAVQQFAIIDSLRMSFQPGLNIISGETGAGKSILLKSLALLMGDKADLSSIREGSEVATVEGLFDLSQRPDIEAKLSQLGLPSGERTLVVRRLISAGAKSRVYINGSLATVSALRDLVSPLVEVTGQDLPPLIEMTGQHDNRNLLSRTYHLELVDISIGLGPELAIYRQNYEAWKAAQIELAELEAKAGESAARIDYIQFQIQEIDSLGLKAGDEREIESSARRLKHLNRLAEFCSWSEAVLSGEDSSVDSTLHLMQVRLNELATIDSSLSEYIPSLASARSLLKELQYGFAQYATTLDNEPLDRGTVETRLNQLRSLQRKYGATANDILAARAVLTQEIEQLQKAEALKQVLEKKIAQLGKKLDELATRLHHERSEAAPTLIERVNKELGDLNMKGVMISLSLEFEDEFGPSGRTRAEFMIANGPSSPARPLARVASGGELSRVLLALKQVIGSSHAPRTYLFDEVDTGVSGETAARVGQKLKKIATEAQVICITHLPQVAAYADSHYAIQKSTNQKSIQMTVKTLDTEARIHELARLISGDQLTSTSIAHARSLTQDAEQWAREVASGTKASATKKQKRNIKPEASSQNLL